MYYMIVTFRVYRSIITFVMLIVTSKYTYALYNSIIYSSYVSVYKSETVDVLRSIFWSVCDTVAHFNNLFNT